MQYEPRRNKMNKKFELLLDDTITIFGIKLFRIKALISFGNVEEGEIGGYVEKETNLSSYGDAWVSGDAMIYGDAEVYGNARVYGDAMIYGDAWVSDNARVSGDAMIYGNARVSGDAEVYGNADYIVFKNNWSSGRYFTYTKSNKMWRVGCFYGTGQELIKKAYQDSEVSGKHYEAYVEFVEKLEKLEETND